MGLPRRSPLEFSSLAERARDLAGGPVDRVLDAARPAPGTIAELVVAAGGVAERVTTISNHDEARRVGARVNLDHLADAAPASLSFSDAIQIRTFRLQRPQGDLLVYAAAGADADGVTHQYLGHWHEAMVACSAAIWSAGSVATAHLT